MAAATILESQIPKNRPNPLRYNSLLEVQTQNLYQGGMETDFHIQIFEKNTSPGKKVIISGGGRCNVTTGIEDKKILLSKYTRGADFIRKAFGKLSPRKCREWFESHGVPMKCEADNRVFPVSDDGTEVVEAFTRIFAKYRDKVTLHYGE
jgi:predicted flavoprotein YhiN